MTPIDPVEREGIEADAAVVRVGLGWMLLSDDNEANHAQAKEAFDRILAALTLEKQRGEGHRERVVECQEYHEPRSVTERYRAALDYYADKHNYRRSNNSFGAGISRDAAILSEGGHRAQEALRISPGDSK